MTKGQHLICDFSGVPKKLCSNDDFLLNVGKQIACTLNVDILETFQYNFDISPYPPGCSVILALSASHIAFHTIADDRTIAVDVFCCNRDGWHKSVLKMLCKNIRHRSLKWHIENRFDESGQLIVTNEKLIDEYEKKVDDSVLLVTPTLHNDLKPFLDVVVDNVVNRGIIYTYIYPVDEHRMYTELLQKLHSKMIGKGLSECEAEKKIADHVRGRGLPDLIHPIPWEMGVYYYKNRTKVGFMEHPNYPENNFIFHDDPSTNAFHRLLERLKESSTHSAQYSEREICNILNRFHFASLSLTNRSSKDSKAFNITREADVQDLLHAILVARFSNIQREFSLHTTAVNKKVDFYFTGLGIALEVKTTIAHTRNEQAIIKEIDSLKVDLANDERIMVFIVFIYVPKSRIVQRKEIIINRIQSSSDKLKTIVVVNP